MAEEGVVFEEDSSKQTRDSDKVGEMIMTTLKTN